MTKVVVLTDFVSVLPEFGGNMWAHMNYVLGFMKLGLDVLWIDRLSPINQHRHHHSLTYLIDTFALTSQVLGFDENWCIDFDNGSDCFGRSGEYLNSFVQQSDLLVALSSTFTPNSNLAGIPKKAYIDLDPGFTQAWIQLQDWGLSQFDHFFTVGLNVDRPGFLVPPSGIAWNPLVPPVALNHWPEAHITDSRYYSTVSDWRAGQQAEVNGTPLLGKRDEFLKVIDMPKWFPDLMRLALFVHPTDFEDMAMLADAGWKIEDASFFAGSARAYRDFLQCSRGEFSVAKHGYVRSRSGWVSDRTACYLASGKPALVQATGFEPYLPVGEGLLTFATMEEAIEGMSKLEGRYAEHCRSAREIAEAFFDSDKVLSGMLEKVGL